MTHNQIDHARMIQEKRAQAANLAETARHNKITEQLQEVELDLKRDLNAINQKWNEKQYELQKSMQAITERHYARQDANQEYANYTARMNAFEQQRHNKEQEVISVTQNALRSSEITEAQRHNVSVENIQRSESVARANALNAQTGLYRAQTTTESVRPAQVKADVFQKNTSGVSNIVNSISNVVKSVSGLIKLGAAAF